MKHLYLRIILEAQQTVHLPQYSGSTLRGALNIALHKQCCMSSEDCHMFCQNPMSCGYGFLCETPIFEHAPKRLKASKFLPHPLIIHPPVGAQTIEAGDVLMFQLTILEPAFIYLPQLIGALEHMAQDGFGKHRGKLTLRRIEQMDTHHVLYQDGERFWNHCSPNDLWDNHATVQGSRLSLTWYTPLHLQVKKRMLTHLNVRELMYAMATRLDILWSIYAPDDPLSIDAKQMLSLGDDMVIIEQKITQVQHERWSNRQQHKHKLQGLVGQITLAGQLNTYWPIIQTAQRVHIGKKTSMAQGAFACHWHD